jgi:hypothetical protein
VRAFALALALLACAPPPRPPLPAIPDLDALERRMLAAREARYHVEVRATCFYPQRIPSIEVAKAP